MAVSLAREYHPIHRERHMRIICIGAGLSGLCFAYKLQRSFDNFDLTIYEKNREVSGVWFENQYPGVACDFPAHNYTFSFEPKKDFTNVYASGPEVRAYIEGFATRHDLIKYCRRGHKVVEARWLQTTNSWQVSVQCIADGTIATAEWDILINGGGVLNNARWPDMEGLQSFAGELTHITTWRESIEYRSKKVGVIGNGSSGQQIFTALQPAAARITNFIRQGNWIFGPFGGKPREYGPEELKDFASPTSNTLLKKRRDFERLANSFYATFQKNSEV